MPAITLSLPYDLDDAQWSTVDEVFASLPGWHPDADGAVWQYMIDGMPHRVEASIEPSGLLLEGDLPPASWTGFVSMLCARLSRRLGIDVCDAEM